VDPESELLGDVPARLPRDEPELLDAEPVRLWRPPRWVLVAVGLAVLLGTLGWHADGRARAHESAALAACRQQLHDAVISSDLELVAAAGTIQPSLSSVTGPQRAALVAQISVPARRLLPQVVAADRRCRSVSVRPWHVSLRHGNAATTAYSAALVAKLRAVAADGDAYYDTDRSLRRLRRAADLGVFGGRY
jgi:hypothetical protein